MFYMRDFVKNNNNKFLSDYLTKKRSHYELFLQSLGYIIAKEISLV